MLKVSFSNSIKNRRGAVEMMEAAAVICLIGLALVAMGPYIKNHVQGKFFETSNDFSKHNFNVNNHILTDRTVTTSAKNLTDKNGVVRTDYTQRENIQKNFVAQNLTDTDINVGASADDSNIIIP